MSASSDRLWRGLSVAMAMLIGLATMYVAVVYLTPALVGYPTEPREGLAQFVAFACLVGGLVGGLVLGARLSAIFLKTVVGAETRGKWDAEFEAIVAGIPKPFRPLLRFVDRWLGMGPLSDRKPAP